MMASSRSGAPRALAGLLLLLSSGGLLAAHQGATSPPTETWLRSELDTFRREHGMPAVAVALVDADGVRALAVSGTRTAGGDVQVTADDLWHIGSVTKSFTATLVARLVTGGVELPDGDALRWETTFGELLPEAVGTPYAGVTLRQALGHRSGLPANPAPVHFTSREVEGAIDAQRRDLVGELLAAEPVHEPGTGMLYSNAGYIVVGAGLERLTGRTWEELLRQHVLSPLGLGSAGFGPPGEHQPQGHLGTDNASLRTVRGPFADNPPFLGPAGTLHLDLRDLGSWVATHLAGETGGDRAAGFLPSDTFRTLHESLPGGTYALGWDRRAPSEQPPMPELVWHNGSNTFWYAYVAFAPELGLGLAVVCNSGVHNAPSVHPWARDLLLRAADGRIALP